VIYNMGFMDHPVGELFEKVNDGRYHVVRFHRDGPNATIQVDQLPVQAKFPTGELSINSAVLLISCIGLHKDMESIVLHGHKKRMGGACH